MDYSSIGNPAPLGLLAFGVTTAILMFVVTGWVPATDVGVVIPYACFFGGLTQFVAGILELLRGNAFAGTAFSSYGAFWMAFFLAHVLPVSASGGTISQTTQTLVLCIWGLVTLGLTVPTMRMNVNLFIVFSMLTATYFLLAGGVWNATANTVAGYTGFRFG